MQHILISSSLDKRIITDNNRYDHNTNQPVLPSRDSNDENVTQLGLKLIEYLDKKFPYD